MKKSFILLTVLVTSLALFYGCNGNNRVKKTNNEKQRPLIGFTFDSLVIERWQRDRDVFISTAENLGAEVYVQNANGDVDKQREQIEYFIEKKVDVIVAIAVDADEIEGSIKKAKEEGIKVIAYDRLLKNSNVDLYLSFDNEKVGELMAEALVESIPDKGNVMTVFGSPSDNNVAMVEKGFNRVIDKSDLNIVDKTYAIGWYAEAAFSKVSEYLKAGGNINGIFCNNDDLAGQAIRALSEQRLAGQIVVVGQDADLAACQRIVEGTQTMTVFKDVDVLARKAAIAAVQLANGDKITTVDKMDDGTYEVPYDRLEPIAVTKDNIDEVIIEGGFHLKEDVYLNLVQ